MPSITSVIAKEGYIVEVNLDNGNAIKLNMKKRLKTVRFGPLEDMDLFKSVSTDGSFIFWNNKVEIALNELLLLVKN